MAALYKIAVLLLGLVTLIKSQSSTNQVTQANIQSITQGMQGFPGMSGGSQGLPGMPSFPGVGSFSSSPQVSEDMMQIMTDPCTYKTLQSFAKLSTDMRAAQEKQGEKKKA